MSNHLISHINRLLKVSKHENVVFSYNIRIIYSTCVNHTYFESQMLKDMYKYCYYASISRTF